MMNPNDPVSIRQVQNGFVVMPVHGPGTESDWHEQMVFNDIDDMNNWLKEHFKEKV